MTTSDELSQDTRKRYDQAIIELFRRVHTPEAKTLTFAKEELVQVCQDLNLGIENVPDIPYHYRTGRSDFPPEIQDTGNWVIEGRGKGNYAFVRLERFAQQQYSDLILRPIGIKPLDDGSLVFIEFDDEAALEEIAVKRYMRYKLIRDDK
jgi:hypothetical protein